MELARLRIKMEIRVLDKNTKELLTTIERKPFHNGMCGNFLPHWVRYKKKEYLLHGGIDSSYIQEWDGEGYIEVENGD